MGNLTSMRRPLFVAVLISSMLVPAGGCILPPPDPECDEYVDQGPAMDVRRRGEQLQARLYPPNSITIESMSGGS